MPSYEVTLPPGAQNIKIKTSTQEIPVDWYFYRHGKDGAEVIIPLFGGDEFIGEVLEGMWKKGDDGSIQGPFTVKLNGSGSLELTGKSDSAGTTRYGWISSQSKVPLLDDIVIDIHFNVGSLPSSDSFRMQFYLSEEGAGSNPHCENFLRLLFRASATSDYQIYIDKRVNGTITTILNYTTVTNNEGTFRIKIEESKLGHEHTHIYYHDGTGSIDESTDEVPGSPFQLDLAINSAYVGYRIETSTTEPHTVSSDFVRVTYPDFKVVYDLDDDDVNKGDVKCYDTMNSNDESDWIRVFDPSHKFVGDCVVENGLIRLWIDEDVQYGLKVFWWDGEWTQRGWIGIYEDVPETGIMSHFQIPKFLKIETINSETAQVKIELTRSDSSRTYAFLATIHRGRPWIEFKMNENIYQFYFSTDNVTNKRFGFLQDNAITDLNIDVFNERVTEDNFALIFHPDSPSQIMTWTREDQQMINYDNRVISFCCEDVNETETLRLGSVPFTQISNLFKEAEDATLGEGVTVDTTQTDDSGDSVLLDAQGEVVLYDLTGVTDLPTGRYIAFIRAKDTNQVANDLAMWVRNVTDARYLNEENHEVYKTLTSSFSYYGLVFDITSDDSGDTIRFGARKNTTDTNSIYVDYFLIVPIGNGESWAQDLAHNAMRTFTKRYKVYKR